MATAITAIPSPASAQVAEAVGCRLGLGLLTELPSASRARVVGDNLAVVRYCAGTARLRRVTMQAHLEVALASILDRNWRLEWQAVRRRLNKQSDELATRGVFWAAERRDSGVTHITFSVTWLTEPAPVD